LVGTTLKIQEEVEIEKILFRLWIRLQKIFLSELHSKSC
jgi:hypothetical protein